MLADQLSEQARLWAESLPRPSTDRDDAIDTLSVLSRLAAAVPVLTEEDDRTAVAALCRKVDIARKIWRAYDRQWDKPVVRKLLPGHGLAVLVAILLAAAAGRRSRPEHVEGLLVLNSALNALDLYRAGADAEHAPALDQAADAVLDGFFPR